MEHRLYTKYNDPVQIIWRKGDMEDPYLPITEEIKVVNNKIVTSEIPYEFDHVVIEDMKEVFNDMFGNEPEIKENQYKVNYNIGIITFHKSKEAETIKISYKGRGYILFPAERIYVHKPNPYAVENLQEFIELAETRIQQVNEAIKNAEKATEKANVSAEYATKQGDYAKEQGSNTEDLINEANFVIFDTEKARDEALKATRIALEEKEKLIKARNETILIWKPQVKDYTNLLESYPKPEVGWTVMLSSSGIVYRYNGASWTPIGNMTLSTPIVSETTDGLMSVAEHIKLKGIEEGAEANLKDEDAKKVLPNYFKTKTVVFMLPSELQKGEQDLIIRFPYNGTIKKVTSSCETVGADNTYIEVLKLSKKDFENKNEWKSIFSSPMCIPFGERLDDGLVTIVTNVVEKDDYFKLNITNVGSGIANVVIELEIEI